MKQMKTWALTAFLIFCSAGTAWAQSAINDIPAEVNAADATITNMGHATMTMKRVVVTDPTTQNADTLMKVENIEWNTEVDTAKKRMARRKAIAGSDFYEKDSNWYLDLWWFNYLYPSINADGEEITLSSMACMPDEDCDYVNNIIVGCHVTITSNKECPTSYSKEGSFRSDVSMLMNYAGSGTGFAADQKYQEFYNLVILPDYEGYGFTKSYAHPYLYQELTARQVVDAVRYGKKLYETSSAVNKIRHPFSDNWRTITMGYSQGASVALATQRFIEQNGLTDELQLAGSVCGDGPYDLMSTLMYYMEKDIQGKQMSMPVVLPLILKGMCDCNPYMKNHQVSEYLDARFLETGILDWLTQKEKTTDDITAAWVNLYNNGKNGDATYFRNVITSDGKAYLNKILKPEGYQYFKNLLTATPNYTQAEGIPLPTHRGLMEDLHFALESNNMTMGWQPQHAIYLYHSYEDTVVPEKNRQRAWNTINDWVIKIKASGEDHVDEGKNFYFWSADKIDRCIRALGEAPIHQTKEDVLTMRKNVYNNYKDE